MCGRFTLVSSPQELADLFEVAGLPRVTPQYNIPPSALVLAVRQVPGEGRREAVLLRWGLIPSWAEDAKIGYRLINARSETAANKPAFRSAFRIHRCLIAADGFYEWKKGEKPKQPFYIRMEDGKPFAFAGLWESWKKAENETLQSCTILTTEANEVLRPLHDRMPVILEREDFAAWLDPEKDPDQLHRLLQPYTRRAMIAYPVGRLVNSPRNQDSKCMAPVSPAEVEKPQPKQGFLF